MTNLLSQDTLKINMDEVNNLPSIDCNSVAFKKWSKNIDDDLKAERTTIQPLIGDEPIPMELM